MKYIVKISTGDRITGQDGQGFCLAEAEEIASEVAEAGAHKGRRAWVEECPAPLTGAPRTGN